MRNDIIDELKKDIYQRAISESNHFGMGVYYHIEAVVKNATYLAEKFKADKEVVIIASWLHDIASITNYDLYPEHHIHGAQMAQEILKKYNYEKIDLVKKCILNHRGSFVREKCSIEEMIVADADAISHFDSVPSLLYLAYVRKEMNIEDGKEFVKNKLIRSYNKLSEKSKDIFKDKYEATLRVLE